MFRLSPLVSACRARVAVAVVLMSAGVAAFAPATTAKVFDPETITLDNGMQVVVASNHRAPVVTHMVWYRVGSIDEPAGRSGIAHVLEHLMFKGTETLAPGEFSAIVAAHGGQENAFTSYDYTGYYQSVAKDRLETVMRIEADRMANLVLTDEVIAPELLVVLEERRSRVENNPGARLSEQADAALFLNHPYRVPIIGWAKEIARLERSDIVDFYRKWYTPNNAILVVSGDVTMADVRPLAEKYYGGVPARAVPEREGWVEPELVADAHLVMKDPQVKQPTWQREYKAPSYRFGESEHTYALQVLSEVLAGGANSRLYRSLVVDRKVAVSAGSWYDPRRRGPATFGFYLTPMPGKDVAAAEAAFEEEFARLLAEGVREEELASAKQRLQDSAIYALDSYRAPAQILGGALAIGLDVADVEAWPERIGAVTVAEVEKAIGAVLRGKHAVTSLLLPPNPS